MHYDEKKADPFSPEDVLISQVQDQSEVCDVTVRVGKWVKRFHRCVLQSNPFFARTFKPGWLEKTNKTVDITVGTPEAVEEALMFIYGREPRVTIENAVHLLDLAEFFVVPRLKAAVVKWLKEFEVTEEAASDLLQIRSYYNIRLPNLDKYVESHLDTLLHIPAMQSISDVKVKYFLSHRKFSYVPMDDKIQFLLRWVGQDSIRRLPSAEKLLRHIDFSEITAENVLRIPMCTELRLKLNQLFVNRRSYSQQRECLIVVTDHLAGQNPLLCFDIEMKRWFRIKSDAFQQVCRSIFMCNLNSCSAEIALPLLNLHSDGRLFSLNLEADNLKIFKVMNEAQTFKPNCLLRSENCVFAYKNSYLFADRHTTFYAGEVDSSLEHIYLNPLFSLRNQRASRMCFNSSGTLAVMSNDQLCLYDTTLHYLTTFSVTLNQDTHGVQMCSFRSGFVIFSGREFVFILEGQLYHRIFVNKGKYIRFACTYDGKHLLRFTSDGHFCFNCRTFHKCEHRSKIKFEFTSFANVFNVLDTADVQWTEITLPQTQSIRKNIANSHFFRMSLPKHRIRCDIDCPHCKVQKYDKTLKPETSDSDLDSDSDDYSDDEW